MTKEQYDSWTGNENENEIYNDNTSRNSKIDL